MSSTSGIKSTGKEDKSPPQVIELNKMDQKTSIGLYHYLKLKEAIEYSFYEIKKCQASLEELNKSKDSQDSYIKFGSLFLKQKNPELVKDLEEEISELEMTMMRNNELRGAVYEKIRSGIESQSQRDSQLKNASTLSEDENQKRETKN